MKYLLVCLLWSWSSLYAEISVVPQREYVAKLDEPEIRLHAKPILVDEKKLSFENGKWEPRYIVGIWQRDYNPER